MAYKVYRVEHHGNGQNNHVQIFIETEPDGSGNESGSGRIYHVTGNILTGMMLETKLAQRPESFGTFVQGSKKLVGHIEPARVDQFKRICEAIPPPGAQLKLNGQLKDPSIPIRRCGDWVDQVLEWTRAEGLLD